MTQNIYDTPEFFQNYSALDRSVKGLAGAPEWPRLQSFLPDLGGRRVLDLGCGFGWFARWAKDAGAERVHGLDVSQNMLDRAVELTARSDKEYQGVTYQRADLDELPDLVPADGHQYDVVFSSLTFHYLQRLSELLGRVSGVLRPGGRLVFSVEHPIFTAPSGEGGRSATFVAAGSKQYWPLADYQREGERVSDWLAGGVRKQHRTLGTYVQLLLAAGFELTDLDEWCPSAQQLAEHPSWAGELDRPMFLLVGATKREEK